MGVTSCGEESSYGQAWAYVEEKSALMPLRRLGVAACDFKCFPAPPQAIPADIWTGEDREGTMSSDCSSGLTVLKEGKVVGYEDARPIP